VRHLKEVGTGYWTHFKYAMWFNIIAFAVVVTGTIHAVFPFLFEKTPYKLAKYIVNEAERKFNLDG